MSFEQADSPPAPGPERVPARGMIWQRRLVAAAVHVLLASWGVHGTIGGEALLAFALTLSVTTTWLCVLDARIRGAPLPWTIHWVIFMTWPAAVPVYLFWSRGWKEIHWAIMWTFTGLVAFFMPAFCLAMFLYLRAAL